MEGGSRRGERKEYFHVIHKVPVGDSPYVRAKHLQLVDKDLDASIVWFWKAINNGDRVDSALKDMALVMKQQNRPEEAIEAIKSFRHLCSKYAQESLDNVLIDLCKKCGMIEEQIELLKKKLKLIFTGEAFNGKTTKTARSHGKKFQVSIAQETSRVLGNLGWAYMQQGKCRASEAVYLKAQMIDADANKACNLSLCLIKQGRFEEARSVLLDVLKGRLPASSTDGKIMRRAAELLHETELHSRLGGQNSGKNMEEEVMERISVLINEWAPLESIFDHSAIIEEISHQSDGIAC
ncbi:protein SULFUR DEFICIENCY-INDUCED 1-like [Phalaenopsis equestris]|uniref:protein SULFUR DEFICIENCY-INDUCED 1-like n=1 Tax=Phalaenopsis equestris TaxID=78828 RepID=UPI0009E2CEB6|nr:protein SULFUR DEFICIENCY-INDUCED 1-like [Phalaenopsis equestris]